MKNPLFIKSKKQTVWIKNDEYMFFKQGNVPETWMKNTTKSQFVINFTHTFKTSPTDYQENNE